MQQQAAVRSDPTISHLLIAKLLDWPFLLFVSIIVIAVLFRREIRGILSREDITFAWGERSIRLRELSENFDKEVDPLRDELEALKRSLVHAQPGSERSTGVGALPPGGDPQVGAEDRRKQTEKRLLEALKSEKYSWRSIERLAAIAVVPQSEVLAVLRSNPEVIFSLDKSGRRLAGLRSRVKPDAG